MNRRNFSLALFASALVLPLGATLSEAASKKGSFSSHKSYKVRGTATVSGSSIKLTGFRTSPGPDLYVYVGNGKAIKLVGKLKCNSGNQTYSISGAEKYSTVHIHCKRFSSTFGTARLK